MTTDPRSLIAFMREKRLAVLRVEPWVQDLNDPRCLPAGVVARVGRNGGRIVAEWGRTPVDAMLGALRSLKRMGRS